MILETIDLLGLRARERVTGMVGVIGSVSFDLYGCVQAVITPPAKENGELVDGRWFDIHRLEILDEHDRVMPVPDFAAAALKPKDFAHGPADKPLPSR